MRIKHNARIATTATIAADEFGIKPARLQASVRAEQAERLLRQDGDERPTTRKPKKGVQAERGRVRVERTWEDEVETSRTVREIYAEMTDIVREMQQFAAENPPAWVRWSFDRHGRGLTVMASPFNNGPCPICATYPISEQGLAQLEEDSGWMA